MRGLCCDAPGLGRLNQLVGREVAAELLFTGRIVGAAEAKELKLVSRVVPHEELLPVALELAGRIAANPPLAVQRIKRGLREALDPDWRALGRGVSASLRQPFPTDAPNEGAPPFPEQRDPPFHGQRPPPPIPRPSTTSAS